MNPQDRYSLHPDAIALYREALEDTGVDTSPLTDFDVLQLWERRMRGIRHFNEATRALTRSIKGMTARFQRFGDALMKAEAEQRMAKAERVAKVAQAFRRGQR